MLNEVWKPPGLETGKKFGDFYVEFTFHFGFDGMSVCVAGDFVKGYITFSE